jgi:hypothetical protein
MRALRLAAAICAALLASACLPVTTKTPIGSSVGFKPDPALYGLWRSDGDRKDDIGFISFLKGDQDRMTAVMISPDRDGGDWQVFELRAATLGGNTFLNARETLVNGRPADDELAGHDIPVLYRLKGRTLTLLLIDEKKTAAAINTGAIAGKIDPGQYGDVHITADAASLDKFMQSDEGIALFSAQLIVMKKVD